MPSASRETRWSAWVLARWSCRHPGPRLQAAVGPCGCGMTWSRSQPPAEVVQPGRGAGGVAPAHGGGEFRGGVAAEFGDVEQGSGGGGEQPVQAGVGVGGEVSDDLGGDDAGAVGELSWGAGGAEQGRQRNDDADGDAREGAGGAVAEAWGDQDGAEFCAVGAGAVADADAGERECGWWKSFGGGGSAARLPAVGRGCRCGCGGARRDGVVRRRIVCRRSVGKCGVRRSLRRRQWIPVPVNWCRVPAPSARERSQRRHQCPRGRRCAS